MLKESKAGGGVGEMVEEASLVLSSVDFLQAWQASLLWEG